MTVLHYTKKEYRNEKERHMGNRIVIIDGNSLINRAYYAMQRPMITKEGIYTQGIYGLYRCGMGYESAYFQTSGVQRI